MATAKAVEETVVVLRSVEVTLTPEEAQKLYTLLYRGVGGTTLEDLGLYSLLGELRGAIGRDKDLDVTFRLSAQL